jgi:hypothetical protein
MDCIIHTPTPNLKDSLDFYNRINFKIVSEKNPTMVTDGQALIEINPDRYARCGIKLFKQSWSQEIAELNKLTAVTPLENYSILADPSGVWIYLVEGQSDTAFKQQEKCFGFTGNFSGLSLETTDLNRSHEFYGILGFEKSYGSVDQGWISLSYKNFIISLMKPLNCPHLFFNPSLTYFNGNNNLSVIKKLKDAGISFTEEITHFNKDGIVDNVIIRDPGGYGFFIFSD